MCSEKKANILCLSLLSPAPLHHMRSIPLKPKPTNTITKRNKNNNEQTQNKTHKQQQQQQQQQQQLNNGLRPVRFETTRTYWAPHYSSCFYFTSMVKRAPTAVFELRNIRVEVLRPVNPFGSCRVRSVYLTTRLLGRLCRLSGCVTV